MNAPNTLASPLESAKSVVAAVKKHRTETYSRKPVFTAWVGDAGPAAAVFGEAGIPHFPSEADAVRGFMHIVRYREGLDVAMQTPPSLPEDFAPDVAAGRAIIQSALKDKRGWLNPMEINELFAASDYISFHVPLNDATRGIFGAQALAVARPGVVLLNFARDGIVDAATLKQGLDDGRIGRYVSDFPNAALLGHPRVIGLPHLGASTGEAEENCALMVVDQLREYLESGNVHNSVNFPNTRMARTGQARLCVANQNRPNMIGQLSHVLGEAGVNIAQMHNASRGDVAYTLIDLDSPVTPALVQGIRAIDGILSVRVIA